MNQEVLDKIRELDAMTNDFIVSWWPLTIYVVDEEVHRHINPNPWGPKVDDDDNDDNDDDSEEDDWPPIALPQDILDRKNHRLVSSLDDTQNDLINNNRSRDFVVYRHRDKKIVYDARKDYTDLSTYTCSVRDVLDDLSDQFHDTAWWPQESRK